MWAGKCRWGVGPLVGQDTETDEPQERPRRCPTTKMPTDKGPHKSSFPVLVQSPIEQYLKNALTWEDKISHYYNLPLVCIAYLREVCIYYEHDDTSQESDDADSHSVAAGAVVFIKHALCFVGDFRVYVALCCNGCKHHNGEQLQTRGTQRVKSSSSGMKHYGTPFSLVIV